MSKSLDPKAKQQSVTDFFTKKPSKGPAETSTQVTKSPSIFYKFHKIVRQPEKFFAHFFINCFYFSLKAAKIQFLLILKTTFHQ